MAVHVITNFTPQDEGIYRCIAENDVTTVDKQIQVLIDDSLPSRGDIVGKKDILI